MYLKVNGLDLTALMTIKRLILTNLYAVHKIDTWGHFTVASGLQQRLSESFHVSVAKGLLLHAQKDRENLQGPGSQKHLRPKEWIRRIHLDLRQHPGLQQLRG